MMFVTTRRIVLLVPVRTITPSTELHGMMSRTIQCRRCTWSSYQITKHACSTPPSPLQQRNLHRQWRQQQHSTISSSSAITSCPPSSTPTNTKIKKTITTNTATTNSTNNNSLQLVRVGFPLILFSLLSAWVIRNAYGGKLHELEVSQGKSSISIRQAALAAEHDDMMERLTKIVKDDNYDNTKRIKRPEEVLEERRLERQKRNVWYRRWYRAISGQPLSPPPSPPPQPSL
jgi:ribosomal protein L37E